MKIPQDYNDAVKGSLEMGGGVTLPFPHVFFSFRNGQRQAGKDKGELFYGGFQADREKFLSYIEEVGGRESLDQFALHEIYPRTGDPYQAYMRRSLAVAPIAIRQRWFVTKEGKNVLKTQAAALMAVGKPLKYVGPVVVTASGYNQSKNLQEAIKKNNDNTANARRQFADNAAANFFYQFVGTFGDENFKMVGSGDNQSPITPIMAFDGKIDTEALLSSLYVGDELAPLVVEYKKQAEPWVEDWKKKDTRQEHEVGTPEPPENFIPDDQVPF